MIGHFDYCIRLFSFRNIDLPLQGVYFVRIVLTCKSALSRIIPYAAFSTTFDKGTPLHSLLPPEVAPDDGIHSTGFLVQFSDEEVQLSDVFRVSLKHSIPITQDDPAHWVLPDVIVSLELLFSNACEVGGFDSILNDPLKAELPMEYTVVAKQFISLYQPGNPQYFRIPLGLVREYDTLTEAAEELASGEIMPCAFAEGVALSSLVGVEMPKAPSLNLEPPDPECDTEKVSMCDRSVRQLIEQATQKQREVFNQMGIQEGIAGSEVLLVEPHRELESLSTKLFLRWNECLSRWWTFRYVECFKADWRKNMVHTAQKYRIPSPEMLEIETLQQSYDEQLMYSIDGSRIPFISYVNRDEVLSPCAKEGKHVIILVHGYQGSAADVGVIRNMLACLCPDAVLFSSKANEDQTEGDIESMGLRLAMEVKIMFGSDRRESMNNMRVSFIAHSLGGLIVRAALRHLIDWKNQFWVFLSLSTPHMGITNSFIGSGVLLLSWFRRSECLDQLTLRDSTEFTQTLIYRSSADCCLGWFKRVLLVGSHQDQYAPLSSSTISPPLDDERCLMLATLLLDQIPGDRLVRVFTHFKLRDANSIDSVIGRAAHIKFLESTSLIQLLIMTNSDMFEI